MPAPNAACVTPTSVIVLANAPVAVTPIETMASQSACPSSGSAPLTWTSFATHVIAIASAASLSTDRAFAVTLDVTAALAAPGRARSAAAATRQAVKRGRAG